jgi:hypothetical protein
VQRPVLVLLGQCDVEHDANLNESAAAELQGAHR